MGFLYERVDKAPTEEQRAAAIQEVLRTNDALHLLGLGFRVEDAIKSIPYNGNCASLQIGRKYFPDEPYSTQENPVYLIAFLKNGKKSKFLVLDDMDKIYLENIDNFMHPDTQRTPWRNPYVAEERKN